MRLFLCFLVLADTENRRLSKNFTSQEEDRALLVKQLVLVKRDNARYMEELNQLKESRMKAESDEQNKYQRQVKSPKKRRKNKPEVNVRFVFSNIWTSNLLRVISA